MYTHRGLFVLRFLFAVSVSLSSFALFAGEPEEGPAQPSGFNQDQFVFRVGHMMADLSMQSRPLTDEEYHRIVTARQSSDLRSALHREGPYLAALDELGLILNPANFNTDTEIWTQDYLRPNFYFDQMINGLFYSVLGSMLVYLPAIEPTLGESRAILVPIFILANLGYRALQIRKVLSAKLKNQELLHESELLKSQILVTSSSPANHNPENILWSSAALFDLWIGRKYRVVEEWNNREFVGTDISGVLPTIQERRRRLNLPRLRARTPPFELAFRIAEKTKLTEFSVGLLIRGAQQAAFSRERSRFARLLAKKPVYWLKLIDYLQRNIELEQIRLTMHELPFAFSPENEVWSLFEPELRKKETHDRIIESRGALDELSSQLADIERALQEQVRSSPSRAQSVETRDDSGAFGKLNLPLRGLSISELERAYFEAKSSLITEFGAGREERSEYWERLSEIESAFSHLSDPRNQLEEIYRNYRSRQVSLAEFKQQLSGEQLDEEAQLKNTNQFVPAPQERYMRKTMIYAAVGAAIASGVFLLKMQGFGSADALLAVSTGLGGAWMQAKVAVADMTRKRNEETVANSDQAWSRGLVNGAAFAGCFGLMHFMGAF